jgi:ATP-dependent RNA helicase DBP3
MLDEGFEPAIKEIVSCCASKTSRQTVMFSATWPEEIRSLAEKYLNANVIRVVVGSEELSANHRVKQIVECIDGGYAKDKRLLALLGDYHASRKNRILVFVLYKKEAGKLKDHT